jgi:hypothetical protein
LSALDSSEIPIGPFKRVRNIPICKLGSKGIFIVVGRVLLVSAAWSLYFYLFILIYSHCILQKGKKDIFIFIYIQQRPGIGYVQSRLGLEFLVVLRAAVPSGYAASICMLASGRTVVVPAAASIASSA